MSLFLIDLPDHEHHHNHHHSEHDAVAQGSNLQSQQGDKPAPQTAASSNQDAKHKLWMDFDDFFVCFK
jgi:hypothetical protein